MNSHHRKDGKWLIDKGPNDSVTKAKADEPSRFSGGDSFIQHRAYIVALQKGQLHNRVTLFCHQVGQIWSYRALVFLAEPCREIYNLVMVSGPAL